MYRLVLVVVLACSSSAETPPAPAKKPARAGHFRVDPSTDPALPPTLVFETKPPPRGDAPDTTRYQVVVNLEEQYSIWPADRELPLGWKNAGKEGTKDECLAYIKEVWTDMRPASLRKKMEDAQPD